MKIITQITVIVILILTMFLSYKFIKNKLNEPDIHKIRVVKNEWRFEPDVITATANKPLELRITNEDTYEHSFYIAELNINQVLTPQKETIINLTPTKKGSFPFYCSIVCGAGHYRMNGKIIIN